MKEAKEVYLYNPFDDQAEYINKYGKETGEKLILNDCKIALEAFYSNKLTVTLSELFCIKAMRRYYELNADISKLKAPYLNYLESKLM